MAHKRERHGSRSNQQKTEDDGELCQGATPSRKLQSEYPTIRTFRIPELAGHRGLDYTQRLRRLPFVARIPGHHLAILADDDRRQRMRERLALTRGHADIEELRHLGQ